MIQKNKRLANCGRLLSVPFMAIVIDRFGEFAVVKDKLGEVQKNTAVSTGEHKTLGFVSVQDRNKTARLPCLFRGGQ